MKKNKILYIITKSNWGGAQRHVFDLATLLSKKGFDITVALGGKGELKKRLESKDIKTVEILGLNRNINIFNDFRVFMNLIRIVKDEKPDILHLHSSKIGGLGSLAGRITKVPRIIFTAHGWPFKEDRGVVSQFFIKILSWITAVLSHKVIVVSKTESEIVKNFPFIKEKISIIYNSIGDIQFEKKGDAREKILKDYKKDSIWIGTIAELHKNKGLFFAIEAIDFLIKREKRNITFVIIGEGEERKNIENFIKEKKLEKNIYLTGHRQDAARLLKAFDIFLLSSVKEGFPYAILEAGKANLPVVATNIGGVPDLIEEGKTGMLVRSKDFKDISLAISYILENKEKTRIMRENLKNKIKNKFNIKIMIKKIMDVYGLKF